MGEFKYSALERVGFYASYFWYKLILPLEVKSPRLQLWWYEFWYSLHKFRDYKFGLQWKSDIDVVTTRFGSWYIRTHTSDAANVSPAFERLDINRMFKTLGQLVSQGKKVLFLDVGGDLGTFSVTIGNRFRSQPVDTIVFEPVPASCALLRRNIELNDLNDHVEVMEVALMDEKKDDLQIGMNVLTPGSSSIDGNSDFVVVKADRLDTLIADRLEQYDAIVMKLDVEGAEKYVLRGAEGILDKGKDLSLLIEDFVEPSIIQFLQEMGWNFQRKITDYNSWWTKN